MLLYVVDTEIEQIPQRFMLFHAEEGHLPRHLPTPTTHLPSSCIPDEYTFVMLDAPRTRPAQTAAAEHTAFVFLLAWARPRGIAREGVASDRVLIRTFLRHARADACLVHAGVHVLCLAAGVTGHTSNTLIVYAPEFANW